MSLRVNTNVEAFNAHRNLSADFGRRCRSRWRSCRPVCASTAPPTTPPAWRSRRACAPRSAAPPRPAATRRTASRSCRRRRVLSTRCTRSCSASASCRSSSRTARCRPTDQAKVTAEVAQLTAELVRIRDSSTFNGIALFGARPRRHGHDPGRREPERRLGQQHEPRRRHARRPVVLVRLDGRQPDRHRRSARSRTIRSTLGAVQNRLEHAVANLGVNEENLSAVRVAASATWTWPRRWSTSPGCRSSRSPAPRCSLRPTRRPQSVLSLLR